MDFFADISCLLYERSVFCGPLVGLGYPERDLALWNNTLLLRITY